LRRRLIQLGQADAELGELSVANKHAKLEAWNQREEEEGKRISDGGTHEHRAGGNKEQESIIMSSSDSD
jgi:hypothetical protein